MCDEADREQACPFQAPDLGKWTDWSACTSPCKKDKTGTKKRTRICKTGCKEAEKDILTEEKECIST